MITLPNGWYDPVYEREQLRHPFVQIWEAQQLKEQAEWQAAQEQAIAERAAWQAAVLADKIAAEAKVFDAYGLTFGRIRELVACEDIDALGHAANRKDVAVLHAWVLSLHGGGVSLRKIGAKYRIGHENLRRWVVRAEQSLENLKAAKEAARKETRRERGAYRFKNGYADKHGRTQMTALEIIGELLGATRLWSVTGLPGEDERVPRVLMRRFLGARGWTNARRGTFRDLGAN
jgi:hypothetical protein